MYELKECNLCKGKSLLTIYSQNIDYKQPWFKFIEPCNFPLLIEGKLCRSCGWIFKNFVYDSDELSRLYNFDENVISAEAEILADKNAKYRGLRIFQTVEPWLPSEGKVLDVGGRNGELMQTILEKGFKVTVLDMDAGSPISPLILKIRSPFLAWNEDKYDLVTMSHVLEHTESPGDFLVHARKLMKKDGIIFIEVPSELITCLIKRHVGDHRHLSYFTRETLRAYLKSSGFNCLSCKLLVDVVGSKIPIIRAVARKIENKDIPVPFNPDKYSLFRSIADLLHPLPYYSRLFRFAPFEILGKSKDETLNSL
jgi:hypothetical protein